VESEENALSQYLTRCLHKIAHIPKCEKLKKIMRNSVVLFAANGCSYTASSFPSPLFFNNTRPYSTRTIEI